MTLSKFTIAELRAQGMLMDMFYDMEDHTFNRTSFPTDTKIIDADTHEDWDGIEDRFNKVRAGLIGASDYLQYRKEMLGYERQAGGKDSV